MCSSAPSFKTLPIHSISIVNISNFLYFGYATGPHFNNSHSSPYPPKRRLRFRKAQPSTLSLSFLTLYSKRKPIRRISSCISLAYLFYTQLHHKTLFGRHRLDKPSRSYLPKPFPTCSHSPTLVFLQLLSFPIKPDRLFYISLLSKSTNILFAAPRRRLHHILFPPYPLATTCLAVLPRNPQNPQNQPINRALKQLSSAPSFPRIPSSSNARHSTAYYPVPPSGLPIPTMGTHAKHTDDLKPATNAHNTSAIPPQTSLSCPPETPPLIDPTNFRNSRLTPSFRDFSQSWNPSFNDSTAPPSDIFSSPDPTAMYNSMALPSPSPLFKDFYPTHSPMVGMVPPYFNGETVESRAHRAEKLSVVEEMNGLFANLPQVELENRSDNNFDGATSNISSPEHEEFPKESRIKLESMAEQTQTTATTAHEMSKPRYQTSQSSCETRPLDTSSVSPSSSPQLTETRVTKKTLKSRRNKNGTMGASKKSSNKSEKVKRPPTRPPAVVKSQPKLTAQIPSNAASTPFAAANAFAMNPALAGMFPFPGPVAAGMSQMYPGAGAMFFQGRPMAFVAGARGPEFIPIDMLAQASAVQYGAAHALQVSGQMNNMAGANVATSQTPYESAGNSRKKRRRQMLERSGCSEEQARENRARALKRLRQKKTVRSQSGAVRYACRKRIAMVRPRVNGRFATKEEVEQTQHEALLTE